MAFESLTDRLSNIFKKWKHQTYLTEENMELLRTTIYYGYDETQPYAWLWAKKHDARIKIAYDDVFDCKQTELAIRPFCSKFSQRKTSFTPLSSIGVSEDCKQELNNMKSPYESYEMVIWRLLLEHYGKI